MADSSLSLGSSRSTALCHLQATLLSEFGGQEFERYSPFLGCQQSARQLLVAPQVGLGKKSPHVVTFPLAVLHPLANGSFGAGLRPAPTIPLFLVRFLHVRLR